MTTERKLITADELLLMPRDGKRYELIKGELVEKMPTVYPHGIVVFRIAAAISNYADTYDYGEGGAGEPGYRLETDPATVRSLDVVWIAPGRIPEGTQGYPQLAPDLAVEVKSPGNSPQQLADKAAMWLGYGSRQVWVADPEQLTITVYQADAAPRVFGEDDELDGGDLLPGFTSPVWRLFRRNR